MKTNLLAFLALHLGFATVLAQPVITIQPQNQTAVAGATVNFSVGATGTLPLSYQWRSYLNATTFTNIPFGTEATLVLTNVQPTSRRFGVELSNASSAVTSVLATLTVTPAPPFLVSASSVNGAEIGLCFSREMNPAGLSLAANYQVMSGAGSVGVTVVSAWPGNTSVVLRLSAPVSGSFRISAQAIRDLEGKLVSSAIVTGRVWGAAISVETIGTPSPPGEFISCQDGRLSMRGGGDPESFHFPHELRTNDFDIQVRVDSVVKHGDPNGTDLDSPYLALGGLMVRNSLDPFSASVELVATPTNGSRSILFRALRLADSERFFFRWGDSAAGFPLWLRIRRSGNNFISYYATNGTDWVTIDKPQFLHGAAAIMQVGLITVSYSLGVYTAADYRDFGDTPLAANASATVAITQAPTNVTIEVGHSATFTPQVSVTGASAGDLIYQWQTETAPGSGIFTNIFFATSPRYATQPLTMADSGQRLRLIARISGGPAAISDSATLIVVTDTTPPRVLAARATPPGRKILVTFSEPVDRLSAEFLFNYSGTDFGVTQATLDVSGTRVTLAVDGTLTPDASRELSVGDVTDLSFQTIRPNPSTFPVTLAEPQRGAALQELYFSGSFPDSPDVTSVVTQLEGPLDAFENYRTRISGLLLPPATGNYHFWMCSDDQGEFWLSTDEDPAHLALLCLEPQWNSFRSYTTLSRRDPSAPENRSASLFPDGIPLVAGQRYYFEALSTEGQGGDNLSVAWQVPGGLPPVDGGPPIPGAYLALLGNTAIEDSTIQITRQPSNAVSILVPSSSAGSRLLLSQDFSQTNGGFTTQQAGNPSGAWTYNAAAGVWTTDGTDNLPISEKLLMSPRLLVTQPGEVRLRFQHRFSFEEGMRDGGQLRVSINGSPFTAVPLLAFSSNGYSSLIVGDGALLGQLAFGNTSPGYANGDFLTSVVTLGFFMPGDTLVIQFLGSWDYYTSAFTPSWVIDSFEVTEGYPGQSNVKFSIEATVLNLDSGPAPLSVVWQHDCGSGFTDIIDANEADYVFQPTAADDGCRYRCRLFTPGAAATSEVATLNLVLPAMTVTRNGGDLILTWNGGTLQEAEAVTGPWTDVPQATSPLHGSVLSARRFYRLRSP